MNAVSLRRVTLAILMLGTFALFVGRHYGETPQAEEPRPGGVTVTSTVSEILEPQQPGRWCLLVTEGRYAA